jgi:hypothetical protein
MLQCFPYVSVGRIIPLITLFCCFSDDSFQGGNCQSNQFFTWCVSFNVLVNNVTQQLKNYISNSNFTVKEWGYVIGEWYTGPPCSRLLICHKDTSILIKTTILPRLTKGLEIVATWHLHIENNEQGQIECEFKDARSINSLTIDTYVTGDLAIQEMALGKESMAGWWCMLCKLPRCKFMDNDREMWTMDEYVRCGLIAKNNNNKPQLEINYSVACQMNRHRCTELVSSVSVITACDHLNASNVGRHYGFAR